MKPFFRSLLTLGASAVAIGAQAQLCPPPLVGHDIRHIPHQHLPHRSHYFGKRHKALVLFDSTTSFGWAGDLYGQQLANLLTHFDLDVTLEPVENYVSGQIGKYGSAYYLGFIYKDANNSPLPSAFINDVIADTKPFVWCGFNLWNAAWANGAYQVDNPAFVSKTGIRALGLDSTGYPSVAYNGTTLVKNQLAPTEGVVAITDPTLASVVATSNSPANGTSIPYIVNGGGNFWYIADNPFMDLDLTQMQDRLIAVGDVLHTVLNVNHKAQHRAFVRIEDVSAHSDPVKLKAIADVLYAEKIPYVICVIPEFLDPFGVYYNGVPTSIPMTSSPALLDALRYMSNRGGQVIMHGDTHQYSNVANAFDAVSADDFEFWRVGKNADGSIAYLGAIPEDSASWVHTRVQRGLNLLHQAGYWPTGWNTPHYAASPTDYDEFAQDFQYSLCRNLTFSNTSDGSTMNYLNMFSPFTFTDEHGMFRLPETCGYVAPNGLIGGPPTLPADLISRAQANLACRDGWAGFYFHWFVDPALLQQTVDGMKGLGYKFIAPSRYVDNN